MKRLLLMVVMISTLSLIVACGGDSESNSDSGDSESNESNSEEGSGNSGVSEDEADYVVGVSQIVEHPSLDRATEGFQDALDEAGLKVSYDVSLAQGDNQNAQLIAEQFVSDEVDLIFGNSTPSAQSALNETSDIPIVFTSVTDPVGSELVESMDNPGGNVTGTADSHPESVPKTVELIKDMGNESIGLIYNSGEQNSVSQVENVKSVASEHDLSTEEATVSSSSEVMQAAQSLAGDVDTFLIVTDNTVVSALESVLSVAQDNDVPVFTSELDSVSRGAFAGFGFDYYDIGFEAGEKAVQILEDGANPGDIEANYPQNLMLHINEDAASNMGVELTEDLEERASEIVSTEEGE
ncbi:ABC transporter substrate-binding protein [Alkalibacillus salilacus]|uniref:ABC transport system substrate-binding protein n=1 Tax=Alkalibacillus salilacus TaxID=284582 RepID=A0ABT9VGG9_9BACI|nr:ABC transporter substrate-binding protein [Alkalibacillus salilacus]MDQ0159950.1 putative ABC transport system substrate-binding protein [Alkalibacillus salilacus]